MVTKTELIIHVGNCGLIGNFNPAKNGSGWPRFIFSVIINFDGGRMAAGKRIKYMGIEKRD